jgi:outer membrane protein assembly factor BamD (BamD/ComL family)
MTSKRAWLVGISFLLALWPVAPTRACYGEKFDGVHFHSGTMDFGTVPRRGCLVGEADDRPITSEYNGGWDDDNICALTSGRAEELERKREARRAKMTRSVRALEQAGRWRQAREECEAFAARDGWTGNLRDHVEVLRQVEARRGALSSAFVRALQDYLEAIPLDKSRLDVGAKPALQRVYADGAAGFLRGHALYQLGSLAYDQFQWATARTLYRQMLREFPKSVKREACLIMIARCALLPGTPNAAQVAEGRDALRELEKAFPRTRFRKAVLGLKGKVALVTHRYNDALRFYFAVGDLESVEIVRRNLSASEQSRVGERLLAEYLRRLERTTGYHAYQLTVHAIRRTRDALTLSDALRFSRRLRRELDIVPPYLYYRLYHCDNKPRDFANMAQLAAALIEQYPVERLSPAVRVKLAEVYYQRRQYTKALRWARLAGQSGTSDRALYVQGASLHKLRRYRAAITAYETLLRRCPDSLLRHGTREELAIAYEAAGDFAKALDQYFALDYQGDIAFFLDAKMTPGQIEQYLQTRPDGPVYSAVAEYSSQWSHMKITKPLLRRRYVLVYTLGIRYMREGKWAQAADWMRKVPRTAYRAFSEGRKRWENEPSPDPLTAIRDLSRLERAVAVARTDNARADALFQYASYYYQHGLLLLYNPILWQQSRMMNFDFYWNKGHATSQDAADLRAHLYAHEAYAHTMRLCLEVARRYPQSPAAPKALYRAACAADRLAGLNETWREVDKRHSLEAKASRLMKRLVQRYPNHPLVHSAKKYAAVFGQSGSP